MPVRNVLKWCVVSFAPPRSRALALFLSPRAASSVNCCSQNGVKALKDSLRTKTRSEERFHVTDKEVESGTRRDGARLNLLLRVRDLSWNLEEEVVGKSYACVAVCALTLVTFSNFFRAFRNPIKLRVCGHLKVSTCAPPSEKSGYMRTR